MPLNYSKWDMLELSDDSDIEEHPNVDKASMIRWKQRDIHEKRQARALAIAKLKSELELNAVLRPRIQSVIDGVSSKGIDHFRSVQRRITESPSPEKPATGAPNQPTYDMMLGQLLSDVWREAAWLASGGHIENGRVVVEGKAVDEKMGLPFEGLPEAKVEKMKESLEERLKFHLTELDKRDKDVKEEIEKKESEQKKKITSEDMRDGWSSSSVTRFGDDILADKGKEKEKKTEKKTEKREVIEVLNPGAVAQNTPAVSDDIDEITPMTPALRAFASIPLGDFSKSYTFIQRDSSVLAESNYDSLLAEAFDAERQGDKKFAKQCVHQALLINYCRKLGRDGVGLFFQRMTSGNPKSLAMFNEDLNTTYGRISTRTAEMIQEEQQEREQIQLVAEDPTMEIGFNLPDGPPPADLKIEGEGADQLDLDQVRAFLERKWEIFQGFKDEFREALKTKKLDEVNKELAKMKVSEAEKVVELLQEGGMLSFSEKGVRDMTK